MPFIDFEEDQSDSGFIDFDAPQKAEKPTNRNPFAVANDTVIEFANAVVGSIAAVADFASPGNRASAAMKEFIQYGEEKQSDIVKAGKQKFRSELAQSETIGEDVSTVGRYIRDNPLQTIAQAAGSFVGPGVAVKGAGAAAKAAGAAERAAMLVGRGAGVATGAAMGGGDAAGDAYELTQQIPDEVLLKNKEVAALLDSGMTMEQVRHEIGTMAARQASVLPALAGGVAGAFGAEKLLAGGAARAGARGALTAGAVEGAGEAVEEGLAQYEGRRAAQEYDPSIDPTKNVAAMATMGGVMGFGAGAGVNALTGGQTAPQEQVAQEVSDIQQSDQLLLENKPDPYISFPDGTVGRQTEVDNYIAGLPEDQQLAARARLLGIGEPAAKPEVSDIRIEDASQSLDEAIAVAGAVVDAPADIDIELRNQQIDQAFAAHVAGIRQQEFDLAEQARRDADYQAAQSQVRDQAVEQANAITQAQGFDTQEPTAMQLAMQEAKARRELYLTPASHRAEIAAPSPAPQAVEVSPEAQEVSQQAQEVVNVEPSSTAALPVPDVGGTSSVPAAPERGTVEASGALPVQLDTGRAADTGSVQPDAGIDIPSANGGVDGQPALNVKEDTTALVAQAKTLLNAAGVTGKERIDILGQVRSGSLPIEDLQEAFPAKDQAPSLAATETAEVLASGQTQEQTGNPQTDLQTQDAIPQVEPEKDRETSASEPPKDSNATRKSVSRKSSGITAAEVTKSITPVRAKWLGFTKINTVQSVADLPADIAARAKADDKTEAVYDPQTKSVHLIADNIASPERAVWSAVHEVVGHGGLRMLKEKSVNEALNLAGANRFVRDLAQAIRKDRGNVSTDVSTEEAIAELAAAIETDDFKALSDRYGVNVPEASKNGLRGVVARAYESVKRFLAGVMGKPVADVSDADVRNLIGKQRKSVESKRPGEKDAEQADAESETDAEVDEPAMQSRAPTPRTGWNAPDIKWQDNVIRTMQDKMVDTKKVVAAIRENIGTIADKWDPYLQEELFHGRSAKRVTDFQESELRPLVQEMQIRKVEIPEFEEYLHNRHAEERNNQIAKVNDAMPDGGSGIDTADARKYLNGLTQAKKKHYEALAKRIDAINKKTRQELVAAGLEKPETIAAWEGAYQYYVPLQREESGAGIGQGFSVRGSSSKRATGSKREVVNVLANLMMQRERAIVRIEKNRVATALLGLAKLNPNADFWKVDVAPTERVVETRGGKDQVIEREVPGFRNKENVVSVRLNGEDHFVIFNEDNERAITMAKAIKNLDADQLGRVLSMSAKVTRYFAAINTQYNPIFGGINLLRDTQGAMLNLSTTPIAGKQKAVFMHTASALRGIYIDLRDHRAGKTPSSTWATLYEEFQNEGGQTGFRDMFATSESRTNALKNELNPDAWMDSRFGKLFTANGTLKVPLSIATKSAAGVFNWLSDYNTAMENAVRLASYKVGKEQGMTNQQAASMAKNLTVNFNRKGQVATQAGAMYAFFNASVQGTTRLAETLSGPMGKKIITGGLLLGSIQALVLAAAGFDEDEPPEHLRSRNIIIPIGDGKYTSIPMPLGFNLIPSISRLTTEFALEGFRHPTKKMAAMLDILFSTFNPIGNAGLSLQTIAPTAIDPLAAISENRDWTGKKIAKEDMSGLAPTPGHMRAKDTASEISKALSYWINMASGGTKYTQGLVSPTPDQIDYLIGQATGGVGREALKVEQTVTSTLSGEDLPPHKVPILGRFYGDTKGSSGISSKFYDNLKDLNAHESEIKGRRADRGDVAGYIRDNPEATLVQMANKVERDVSALRKVKRNLLEKDAPAERIKQIELQISNRMKQLNDRVIALREKKAA